MTELSRAVFLSYASQDAVAAQRICEALRAAGIEVWFDQSELRGGDVWDQKIRREIRDCALFIPVISANTASRHEGYFRLEWDLADERTHRMARDRAFIVPICLDSAPSAAADVPESFHRVQWTRLSGGETPAAFVERIDRLLSPGPANERLGAAAGEAAPLRTVGPSPLRRALLGTAVLLAVASLAYLLIEKLWISKPSPPSAVSNAALPSGVRPGTAFNPPPHSIAVLPFVDMSERHDQEYFSDGLSEEMIDRLSQSDELRVIARTSSFYFKGKQATIGEIARTLNVAHVLEGSVRKNGKAVRISAQLIRSSDGSNVWSQTYDRNLVDIFKVQEELAGAVADALKVALRGASPPQPDEAAAEAYNLLLEADFYFRRHENGDPEHATELYRRAVELDPKNVRALLDFAGAILHIGYYHLVNPKLAVRQAMEAAKKALSIDPSSGSAHRFIAAIERDVNWDWARASAELEQALALASTPPQRRYALESIEYLKSLKTGVYSNEYERLNREDLSMDPLDTGTMKELAEILTANDRAAEAVPLITKVLQLTPNTIDGKSRLAWELMYLGRYTEALAIAQTELDGFWRFRALACIQWAMGKKIESDEALAALTKMEADSLQTYFVAQPYLVAEVHACRGESEKALDWLDRAYQLHSGSLPELNLDPMFRILHGNPRFHALQVKMNLVP